MEPHSGVPSDAEGQHQGKSMGPGVCVSIYLLALEIGRGRLTGIRCRSIDELTTHFV